MTILAIGIIFIAVMQVVALALSVQRISVVKAGDVDEVCSPSQIVDGIQGNHLIVHGQSMSVAGLTRYFVHGNSMKPFGVNDGQTVYVESVESKKLKNKEGYYPIAVFEYNTDKENDCDIKLRKFLTFVNLAEIDIDGLYLKYGKYLSKKEFEDEIKERIDELKKDNPSLEGDYILSITHRYKLSPAKYHYSIHSANKIRGLVKYVA